MNDEMSDKLLIRELVERTPLTRPVVKRFISGDDVAAAVAAHGAAAGVHPPVGLVGVACGRSRGGEGDGSADEPLRGACIAWRTVGG